MQRFVLLLVVVGLASCAATNSRLSRLQTNLGGLLNAEVDATTEVEAPVLIPTANLIATTEIGDAALKVFQEKAGFFGTITEFLSKLRDSTETKWTTLKQRIIDNAGTNRALDPVDENKLWEAGTPGHALLPKTRFAEAKCIGAGYILGLTDPKYTIDSIASVLGIYPWPKGYANFYGPNGLSSNTPSYIERLLVCNEKKNTIVVMALPPFIKSGKNGKHISEHIDVDDYHSCPVCMEAIQKTLVEVGITAHEIAELAEPRNADRLANVYFVVGAYHLDQQLQALEKAGIHTYRDFARPNAAKQYVVGALSDTKNPEAEAPQAVHANLWNCAVNDVDALAGTKRTVNTKSCLLRPETEEHYLPFFTKTALPVKSTGDIPCNSVDGSLCLLLVDAKDRQKCKKPSGSACEDIPEGQRTAVVQCAAMDKKEAECKLAKDGVNRLMCTYATDKCSTILVKDRVV